MDWLALQVTPVKSHGKHDRVAHSLANCHCLDASAKYLTLSVHLSSRLGPDAEACSSSMCRSSTASSDLPSFKLCTNCRMVFIVDHFLQHTERARYRRQPADDDTITRDRRDEQLEVRSEALQDERHAELKGSEHAFKATERECRTALHELHDSGW